MARYKWTGAAANGDYNDPANWIKDDDVTPLSGAPTGADDFVIQNGDAIDVTAPGGAAHDLTVDNGTLNADGNPLDVARTLGVGQSDGANGNLNITNTTVSANTSGVTASENIDAVFLGGEANSAGTILVDGQYGPAALDANGTIVVGVHGSGFLSVLNGATLTGASYDSQGPNGGGVSGAGQYEGSFGNITIDNSTYIDGGLTIGDAGTAEMFILNNAQVTLGFVDENNDDGLTLGGASTGDGSLTVMGGAQLTLTAQTHIGSFGAGNFTIANGSNVTATDTGPGFYDFSVGTFNGSSGTVGIGFSTLHIDGNAVIADQGTGSLTVDDGAFVTVSGELDVANQGGGEAPLSNGHVLMSGGFLTAHDMVLSGNLGNLDDLYGVNDQSGGDALLDFAPGEIFDAVNGPAAAGMPALPDPGNGVVYVEHTLAVRMDGTIDMSNIGATDPAGQIIVGGTINDGVAGELKLNEGGELILDNGVIKGGTLDLAGGAFTVTPNNLIEEPFEHLNQFGDRHSVLDNVTLTGNTLALDKVVLTFANGTHTSNIDQYLLSVYDSLIDLRQDVGAYELGQAISVVRTKLTVDADPGLLGTDTNFIIQQPYGQIFGSGEIISEYTNPDTGGFYSAQVNLLNHGVIEANTLGYTEEDDGEGSTQLRILVNTITNADDGIFRAMAGATLAIGTSEHPLDDTHVFTNLTGGQQVYYTLDGGYYDVLDGGLISIVGNQPGGEAYGPVTILQASLSLTGSGEFEVNYDTYDQDIRESLTTIRDSLTTDTGGQLHLFGGDFFSFVFSNQIEVGHIDDGDLPTLGGWLALENAFFRSNQQVGLVIDGGAAWTPGVDAPTGGYLSGNGSIVTRVEMNGFVETTHGGGSDTLSFYDNITGSGAYLIGHGSTLDISRKLGDDALPKDQNYIFFGSYLSGAADTDREILRLRSNNVSRDTNATLVNFGAFDTIVLTNVRAISAALDAVEQGQLDIYDSRGEVVGTLQLDPNDSRFDEFGGGDDVQFIVFSDPSAPFYTNIQIDTDPGNAPPDFTLDPASVTEDASDPVRVETTLVTGTFTDDQLSNHTLVTEGGGQLGILAGTLGTDPTPPDSSTIDLEYSVADSAIDYLAEGEQREEIFYPVLSDGHGSTVHPYTVTIYGTNDAPMVGLHRVATDTFTVAGDASRNADLPAPIASPDGATAEDIYQLTPNDLSKAGAVWQQIDLSKNLTLHARVFFGNVGADESLAADGLTFAIQNTDPFAIGQGGGSLGLDGGVPDAVGITFNTDDAIKTSQFFVGGSVNNTVGSAQALSPSLNNGGWHDFVFTYDATTHLLSYTVDGVVTDGIGTDLADNFGVDNVFMGFTGGTGAHFSEQNVQIVSIFNGVESKTDAFAENGPGVTGDVSTHDLSFTVPFFDADLSDADYTSNVTGALATGVVSRALQNGGQPWGIFFISYLTPNGNPTKDAGTPWRSASYTFSAPDKDFDYLSEGETVTFSYRVEITDSHGATGFLNDAIFVTVTGTDDDLIAIDDSYDLNTQRSLNVLVQDGVTTNDPDVSEAKTVHVDSPTSNGSLIVRENGSFVYRPDVGFAGIDQFTYHTTEGATDSNAATVTLDATDVVANGSNNETLDGGVGADTMFGSLGNDIYLVNNSGDVVIENIGEGTDTVKANVDYTLQSGVEVEYLRANVDSGLTLTGNEFSHKIYGGAGGDHLNGGTGVDYLTGGAGADTMAGGGSNDVYYVDDAGDVVNENVGEGADTVYASVDYTLQAGTEVETLRANAGNTGLTLTGNEFSHKLYGGGGADHLNGGTGNDFLYGLAGADTMAGGGGNDAYYVDDTGDVVNEGGSGGADIVYASADFTLQAGTEVETLRANAGNTGLTLTGNEFSHKLYGGAGDDHLNGGIGTDYLYGLAGADTMTGGGGNDIYYVDNASDVVNEGAGGGNDIVYASVDFTLLAGTEVETLRANAGNTGLTLTGNEFSHKLYGGAGDDHLNGGIGADYLYGLAGADTMAGGGGNDAYYVDNASDVVNENAGEGADTVYTTVDFTLQAGTEVETLRANAGNTGLTLTGNEFSHKLYGGGGGDHLNGGTGNDALYGLAGADTMAGGDGDDLYYVTDAGDVVTENAGEGADAVYTSVNYTLQAGTEVETLRANAGNAGLTLTGNEFSHKLYGGTGGDHLNGGTGNDFLYGLAGADTMAGGLGNDAYYVDHAGDVVNESVGAGTDIVYTSVDYALGAGTEVETLRANAGNTGLSLTGNAFSHAILGGNGGDTLNGGGGNDSLSGGAGDDLLFGNAGTDTLNGGLGIDTYGFHTAAEGKDMIAGFVSGTDFLQVSAAGFGGGLAANAAVQLVTAASAGAASGGATGYFIFDNAGADKGTVYWDATGGSGSDAVAIATLSGVSSLQASDFKVVA